MLAAKRSNSATRAILRCCGCHFSVHYALFDTPSSPNHGRSNVCEKFAAAATFETTMDEDEEKRRREKRGEGGGAERGEEQKQKEKKIKDKTNSTMMADLQTEN